MNRDILLEETEEGNWRISTTKGDIVLSRAELNELKINPLDPDLTKAAERVALELNTQALAQLEHPHLSEQDGVAGKRSLREKFSDANVVLIDSTTFRNAIKLIQQEIPPSAFRIFDLRTFVYATVLFDEVVVTAGPDVAEVNELLEEVVFQPLPPVSAQEDQYIFELWYGIKNELEGLLGDDESELAQIWAKFLDVDIGDIEFNWELVDSRYNSPPDFYRNLSYEPTEIYDTETFVTLSTFRSFFNHELARQLGITYLPNSARGPLEAYLLSNIDQVKPAFDAVINEFEAKLEDEVTEYAKSSEYLGRSVQYRLPMLLAVLINRSDTLAELAEQLVTIRSDASGYRARARLLTEEIEAGNLDRIEEVQSLLEDEATGLSERLGGPSVIAGLAVAPDVPGFVGEAVAFVAALKLLSGYVGDTFDRYGRNLYMRLRQPHYYFLSNVSGEARELTSMQHGIDKLWDIDGELDFEMMERIEDSYPYFV